ncbi:MAG TPA: hypothetical protein VNX66_00665 [Candidatus Sulfotelmatobacter sp.]|nr:hypothetical protein [Candidatus Sulfotelmatobacter sp.]
MGEYFWGTLAEHPSGTQLTGFYGMAPALRMIGFGWFAILFGIAAVAFSFMFRDFLQGRIGAQAVVCSL